MVSVRSCTTTTTTESQAESQEAEYQEDENNKDSQPSLRFAQEQVEQQEGDNITEQGSDAVMKPLRVRRRRHHHCHCPIVGLTT